MLRHWRCILSHVFSPSLPSTSSVSPSPLSPLHRFLSATASSFAAKEYLVANCGVTTEQALKASKKLSHLNSPSKPDAVLAFLADLGLSRADVATVVSKDPRFLCSDVEKTLAPRVVELSNIGLSRAQVARLVLTVHITFRTNCLHRKLPFWLSVFGSFDELLKVVKMNNSLLTMDLLVAKSNLEFLHQSGISFSDGPHRFVYRMITRSTEHLREALVRVDEFGIERDSLVFPHALSTFAMFRQHKLSENIQLFEKLGWSRDDIVQGVRRAPQILRQSEEKIRRTFDFLIGDVGLEISYIANNPAFLLYSLKGRLLPRHCLIKFLKAKGLLTANYSFCSIAAFSNEKFLHRFVHRYEESIPGLAAAFASSCSGKHMWEHLCKETGEEKVLTL